MTPYPSNQCVMEFSQFHFLLPPVQTILAMHCKKQTLIWVFGCFLLAKRTSSRVRMCPVSSGCHRLWVHSAPNISSFVPLPVSPMWTPGRHPVSFLKLQVPVCSCHSDRKTYSNIFRSDVSRWQNTKRLCLISLGEWMPSWGGGVSDVSGGHVGQHSVENIIERTLESSRVRAEGRREESWRIQVMSAACSHSNFREQTDACTAYSHTHTETVLSHQL